MPNPPHRLLGAAAALCLALVPPALAQVALPYVPPELYQERRWVRGDKVTFCVWERSPTSIVDEAIAQALGDALLLDVGIYRYEILTPLIEDEFWETVFIQLAQNCDAIMGFALVSETVPDWLTATRAYYDAPYLLATRNPDYERLGDIPPGEIIGSVLFSPADLALGQYMAELPEAQRWRRYPLSSLEQALDFLERGEVVGSIFWAPALVKLTGGDPAGRGIRAIPLDPLPRTSTPIGLMLREHNAFLRTQLDEAIGTLAADGTLDAVFEAAGFGRLGLAQ